MREYSAISVSAADATSLANRLTEQAQQGWALVEIVHTNDQVVAYLEREGGSASGAGGGVGSGGVGSGNGDTSGAAAGWSGAAAPSGVPSSIGVTGTEVVTAVQDDAGNAAIVDQSSYSVGVPTADPGAGAGPGWGAGATGAVGAAAGYAAGATQSASDTASGLHDQASGAVDSASDHATSTVSGFGDSVGAGITSDTGHHDSGHHDSGQHDSGQHDSGHGSSGHSDNETPSSGVDSGSGSSDGMAPAGWYGDPAGRFELRYWDGTQWTEHVASGSEQAIDPPIKGNE